jgi:ABC-type sugar transport system ATPase subunit
VKILAGFYHPDDGTSIELEGQELDIPIDPKDIQRRGLRFVHQNPALVHDLTVADNIALAQGFSSSSFGAIGSARHKKQARRALSRLGVEIDPELRVATLSTTERMLVAIARAVDVADDAAGAVVVMDEPTAYLPPGSVDTIMGLIQAIRDSGGTVIYVTHRIDEVLRIADDMLVLRDGRVVEQRAIGNLDASQIAAAISGAPLTRARSKTAVAHTRTVFEATDLTGHRLRNVSLRLAAGQVIGVAGLIGSGRSELARIVAGEQRPISGKMTLKGNDYMPPSPRHAIRQGVAYVPPDRQRQGVIDSLSLKENVTLGDLSSFWTGGRMHKRSERSEVMTLIKELDIRPPRTEQPLSEFSGGNQQKAILSKLLRLEPEMLVVDEPTQGIDVEGTRQITNILRDFASSGGCVIAASSDYEEIRELCDQVLVLDRGRTLGLFDASELDEHRLALLAADTVTTKFNMDGKERG